MLLPYCPITNKRLDNSNRFYGCRCALCATYWKTPGYAQARRGYQRELRKQPRHKTMRKTAMARWRYGLTFEEYNKLRQAQNYCCQICKIPEKSLSRRLDIDHNHRTNKIRGLLCSPCNRGIGAFRDDLSLIKLAQLYLETTEPLGEQK